jgi:hypothetical protein
MSKIFRLGDGSNTYTDWNGSPSFPYNSNNRKKIQDPDGATAKKEITSIPSPFARIDLVKNAFREVCESNNLDGQTIFHKMVSDAFDIGEIFFNIDRFNDKVEIITWNSGNCIKDMMSSSCEGHKYLGNALNKYLQSDAKAYNFASMQNIYILNYKKGKKELNIIGATSPATMFFSNANDLSYLSSELSFEKDKPFDSIYNPLYKRDAQYVKSLFLFRKLYPNFASVFPELNDYFDLTFQNLTQELREEIRSMDVNNAGDYGSISVSHGAQNDIVEILGQKLFKLNGTTSIENSDFLIDSTKCDEQILVLPIDRGNTYSDLVYVTEKWGDQKYAQAYDEREITDRTLPSRGDKQPYLTISDFLEPQIIRVPYLLNEEEFYTAHLRKNGEEATFLLPLKPLFFKYFSVDDIINNQMISVSTISKSSADVTLRIPIRSKKQRKYVEYTRSYYDSGADPDESNNKGTVCEMKISGFVMPNVRFMRSEEAIYKVGLVMLSSNRYKLSFYNDDQIIRGINPSVRQGESELAKNAVYTVSHSNFDFIRISANTSVHSIIIPKFKSQTINNEFKFAVDLGTSNTHIEVSKNGRESESYGYLKSPVSKFFVQTFDDHGGPKNLQIENNIMEKDMLPALVGNGSDFRFPTRTILSCAKSIDWAANLNCFEMHNIPLTYGKRVELSYNDYHYDIKWGTEEKDKAILRCYIDDMMFMLRSKVVVEGGDLAKTKLTWFFPISMPGGRKQKLSKIWNEKFAEYFPGSTNGIEAMSESYAPVLHYRNENTTVSNLVNIDIGGGTTDVAYFVDKELSFVTSFKFAANDIFQDAYAKDTVHNGIVDAYKDKIKAVLESNSNDTAVRDVLSIFDSDNNRHPANMASFLFSLRDNQNLKNVNQNKIDFNELLQDDEQFKIVFVLFYTAIIYHIAQIVKLQQLPLPRHISLSGNGSKVIKIISTDTSILSSYTKKIFEMVTGQSFGSNPLGIIGLDKEGSKESTCKGGILGSEPDGNLEKQVILKSTGDELMSNVVFGSIDEAYKKTVEQSTQKFFEFFFSLCPKFNMKDNFGITNNSIDTARQYCNQDLGTFINRGLDIQRKDYEDSDPLRETLFFYPLKGFLSNLINNLTE